MKGWTRSLAALAAAALLAAPAAATDFSADLSAPPAARGQGKLDLDLFAPEKPALRSPADAAGLPLRGWVPGDPRDARAQPAWVRHLSHIGYAGLGVAGLAGSIATGGVAPAIGFGLVALAQSYFEWRELKNPPPDKAD
ncbi:MAG TPA: hypothetical protein VH309_06070 [Elusimicrobiota bacterium]|jgi:hypothetical protein|nr:hypothetical protein [Elusimicrobiota bacterium]